jgi:hypothetical protein
VPDGPTLPQLAALLTPEGQQLLGEAAATADSPEARLAAGTRLRAGHPADLVAAAFGQAELRRRARGKFSRADRMYFSRAGLEQATSEQFARHRAARFAGCGAVADLCTGIGGDLIALAAGHEVLAADRDEAALAMAELNAAANDAAGPVSARPGEVSAVPLNGLGAVFIDPARRAAGRRLRGGASDPPLEWCLGLAGQVPRVAVKFAPGIDLRRVPPGWEAEFTATGRELREAVLWSPAWAAAPTRATVLPEGAEFTGDPADRPPAGEPGPWLLDPSPAITRAGLVGPLARRVGGWQIDPAIAFLAAGAPVRTPFARLLRVEESLPWRLGPIAEAVARHDIGALDIRRRGLAGDVADIHRRLRPRGSRRATLVMTRVSGKPWALLCTDPDVSAGAETG